MAREAVIVDSVRTGLCKAHRGSLNRTRPDDQLAHVIAAEWLWLGRMAHDVKKVAVWPAMTLAVRVPCPAWPRRGHGSKGDLLVSSKFLPRSGRMLGS